MQYWPFFLSLWEQMLRTHLHTSTHTHKQASTAKWQFRVRRITHRLMKWKKREPTKKPGKVLSTYFMISCLEFSQLLKISCLSWCRSCLEWPSVIFTHKLTVLMYDKCHFVQLFRRHLRSCNKQWHFLDSSTLTPVNTITLYLCYYS